MVVRQGRIRLAICFVILLLLAIIVSFLSTIADKTGNVYAYNENNLLRFHVLANSNLPADQDLKLKVRDAVLNQAYQLFSNVAEKGQAKELVLANESLIYETAIATIRNEGFEYNVKLELGTFDFPNRDYGDLHLPAGDYDALRIIIGEGKGDNWWCVLFPPLCFADLEENRVEDSVIALSPDLKEGEVQVRFRFWERLKNTKALHKLEEWWLAGVEMANSLTLPMLKAK